MAEFVEYLMAIMSRIKQNNYQQKCDSIVTVKVHAHYTMSYIALHSTHNWSTSKYYQLMNKAQT